MFGLSSLNIRNQRFLPFIGVTVIATLVGVGIAIAPIATGAILGVAGLTAFAVLVIGQRVAEMSIALVILSTPFYQYRFDLPFLPVHMTLHRLMLLLAIPIVFFSQNAVLDAGGAGKLKGFRSKRQLSLIWLMIWFMFEVIASARSDSNIGVNRLFPRFIGILTSGLIVIYVHRLQQIYFVLKFYVLAAIVPAGVALWQLFMFLSTGDFPGVPFQSFLAANLSNFEQAYKGAQFYNLPGVGVLPRFASVMVDPNFLSAYLSAVTVVALGLFYFRKRKQRRVVYFGVLVFLAAVSVANLVTMSRSGFFGLMIGLIILFLFHPVARQFRVAVVRVMIAFLVFLGAYLLVVSQVGGEVFSLLLQSRLGMSGFEAGVSDRIPHFRAGFDSFLSNPLFGVGAANTLRISPFFTTHSSPLTILAEFGVLGFVYFYGGIMMFAGAIFQVWRRAYKVGNDDVTSILVTALAGFSVLIVATIPYDHLLTLEINYVFLGVILAIVGILPSLRSILN